MSNDVELRVARDNTYAISDVTIIKDLQNIEQKREYRLMQN